MQKKKKNTTISTIGGLIIQSPMFLLVSMILSFIIMFGVQMFYYSGDIFIDKVPSPFNYIIGAAIGLMTQLSRLAFGIAGAADFARGKIAKGLSGMLFSLGLAIVGAYEVNEMAIAWSGNDPHFYNSSLLILQLVVWLGFLLEIRIAISVGGQLSQNENNSQYVILDESYKNQQTVAKNQQTVAKKQQTVGFSTNGST